MSYMEDKIPEIVGEFYEELPKFPDGRINYSKADKAATTVVFLIHEDEILLLKRSEEVKHRQNKWGVVAGFLDELKPLIEKSFEEVEEETGVEKDMISSIEIGETYRFNQEETTFISHPMMMDLETKPEIEISWEHTEYKWVKINEAKEYLPGYAKKELKMLLSKD